MIGRIAHSIHYTRIAMVFVESKHVLPKEILKDSDFADLNSAVALDREKVMYAIISHRYKLNTQIRREKQLGLYYKFNLTVLWFVNIVG